MNESCIIINKLYLFRSLNVLCKIWFDRRWQRLGKEKAEMSNYISYFL